MNPQGVVSALRRPLPRRLRNFFLYIGPAIYIEHDITRLIHETSEAAYQNGYAKATDEYSD